MADQTTDALVKFGEALRSDPNGSDVSRDAASQLVDALTTPPAAAPDATTAEGTPDPAAAEQPQG